MANWIERLDAQIADLVSDWNLYTTLLAIVLVTFLVYPIFFQDEPDTHPLLLARQATASLVRQKNESAVYRSPEVGLSFPLKSGLNVKEPGAPRWASGKDGDLRDIWRVVQRGGTTGQDGQKISAGVIMTVLGKEQIVEHDIAQLSKQIAVMGSHLKSKGVRKVAIYLPNSVEFLLTIFACAFYGLTPILLPYNQPHPKIYELLNTTGADSLIAAAGNVPLDDIPKECSSVKTLIWVVEPAGKHMDWNGSPEGGRPAVGVWHDIIEDGIPSVSSELPDNETGDKPQDVIIATQPTNLAIKPTITTFTHRNLVSATAALISTIPLRQRLTPADLVLPASSFSLSYVLCNTLAALYSHASLAINSVAAPGVPLKILTRGIQPTVIIASAETLAEVHRVETASLSNPVQKLGKFTHEQAMSSGRMPSNNFLFSFLAPAPSASGNKPGTLRLLLTSERFGSDTPALSSGILSDLRIFTGSRICYALTAPDVAGAVAQSNVFDYRKKDGDDHSHFGVPLSCVELKLLHQQDEKLGQIEPEGEVLVVKGASVSGGEVRLPREKGWRIAEDCTLAYA